MVEGAVEAAVAAAAVLKTKAKITQIVSKTAILRSHRQQILQIRQKTVSVAKMRVKTDGAGSLLRASKLTETRATPPSFHTILRRK